MNDVKASMSDRISLFQQNAKPLSSSSTTANAAGKIDSTKIDGKSLSEGKELPLNKPVGVISDEQVKNAVSKLNEYVQSTERTLDFQMDEDSGKTVIKVFDKQSSELIRQIPNELALELAQNLNDDEPSLLFSAQV